MPEKVIKNKEYIVDIIDYGMNGEGIAKIDNFTIFVNRAMNGEKCKILITKVLKNYAYAKLVEVIEPSKYRIESDCPYYIQCGGCDFRYIKYEETLKIKREKVQNLVNKNLKTKVVVDDTIGMDDPYYYRNKSIFPISGNKRIGMYRKRSHDIVEIDSCKIHTKRALEIAQFITNIYEGKIYNENTQEGILRNIMIREGFKTNEIMVVLVQTKNKKYINTESLVQKFPQIQSIIINVNNENTNVILGKENHTIYGNEIINDRLGEFKFIISPNSFYQVNPVQTERIYNLAIEKAKLKDSDNICDLYCGIGTIGIFASKYVSKVYGIEIVHSAIENAKKNAKINNVSNIEFIEGDVEIAFDKLVKDGIKPNIVFVDPPRKGLDEITIANLINLKPEKVIYVSCNPATLIRDLQKLEDIYNVESITPVDNFCYTTHVECVAQISLKKSNKT